MKTSYFVCTLLLLCLLAGGCAMPEDQGKIVRSGEVDQLIESATVLPDHSYYFTGPEAEPDAIIAVNNRYSLKSKYWIRVDAVEEQLKDWNRFIENSTRYSYPFEGARIMTRDGQQVGIWYSKYDHSYVHFPDDASIVIYTPVIPLETRKPSFRRFPTP